MTRRTVAWLGVAGMPLAAAGLMALALVMALVRAHPMWREPALTLAEAAALRDAGQVARLVGEGQDPNGRYPVRAGILSRRPLVLTPLEAARAAERPEIIELLVDLGATP